MYRGHKSSTSSNSPLHHLATLNIRTNLKETLVPCPCTTLQPLSSFLELSLPSLMFLCHQPILLEKNIMPLCLSLNFSYNHCPLALLFSYSSIPVNEQYFVALCLSTIIHPFLSTYKPFILVFLASLIFFPFHYSSHVLEYFLYNLPLLI